MEFDSRVYVIKILFNLNFEIPNLNYSPKGHMTSKISEIKLCLLLNTKLWRNLHFIGWLKNCGSKKWLFYRMFALLNFECEFEWISWINWSRQTLHTNFEPMQPLFWVLVCISSQSTTGILILSSLLSLVITLICDAQVQTLVSEFSSGSPCLILKEAGPSFCLICFLF